MGGGQDGARTLNRSRCRRVRVPRREAPARGHRVTTPWAASGPRSASAGSPLSSPAPALRECSGPSHRRTTHPRAQGVALTMDSQHVLTVRSNDRPGSPAEVTGLLFRSGGNILDAQHFNDRETGRFFMRLSSLGAERGLTCLLCGKSGKRKVLIPVSALDHCLSIFYIATSSGPEHGGGWDHLQPWTPCAELRPRCRHSVPLPASHEGHEGAAETKSRRRHATGQAPTRGSSIASNTALADRFVHALPR
jgi:hypothetical protein